MIARVRAWRRLTWREQVDALEAAALLTASWMFVRLLPFRAYAQLLGRVTDHAAATVDDANVVPECAEAARDVRRALGRGARVVPLKPTCLMLALAGRLMLRRRGCPAAVFVGATRSGEHRFGFHAWLHAGGVVVSGGHARDYRVLATFR